MAGPLPTSPDWAYPGNVRDALPYGVVSWCFGICPKTPVRPLRYLPPPCICMTATPGQPAVPWMAPLAASAGAPAH